MLHSHLHFELANNTQIRAVNNYWNLNIQYIKIGIQLGNEILQLFVFQTAQKAKVDFLHKIVIQQYLTFVFTKQPFGGFFNDTCVICYQFLKCVS